MDTVLALREGSQKYRRIAVADFDPRIYTLAPGESLPEAPKPSPWGRKKARN